MSRRQRQAGVNRRPLTAGRWPAGMLLLILLASLLHLPAGAQNYKLNWGKIAGGGGTSTNSEYSVSDSIGQADAGTTMSGAGYAVSVGVWSLVQVVQTPGLPFLSITYSGNSVIVSWPNTGSYSLQQNCDLSAANGWTVSSYPLTTASGTNSVTITSPTGNLFFRLGSPQSGSGQITGYVTCNNTDPAGTYVYIPGTSLLAYVGAATANGYPYQLSLVPPGTYTLSAVTSSGYVTSTTVTVAAGQTVANVNFIGANLLADLNNCGSCGNACPSVGNGAAGCFSGSCGIASCNSGYANCDGNAANGCETHTAADINNCGGCGVVCSGSHMSTVTCAGGACNGTCATGYADCNNNRQADGCETSIATDINNCGTCGHVCNLANATASCASGACVIASCNSGYGNCDGNAANGCEVNLNTDTNNCGSCGHVCSLANATASCSSGACAISACNSGYANCDGNAANGCETHTATDANNCGACGHVCANGHACSNGTCL